MVYQDPAQAMNPTLRVGRQLVESFTLLGHNKSVAHQMALDALRKVRVLRPGSVETSDQERAVEQYARRFAAQDAVPDKPGDRDAPE